MFFLLKNYIIKATISYVFVDNEYLFKKKSLTLPGS